MMIFYDKNFEDDEPFPDQTPIQYCKKECAVWMPIGFAGYRKPD
jgi:hypothetical protein